MCLTMIDTVTGWFEIVELPVVENLLSKQGKYRINKCLIRLWRRLLALSINCGFVVIQDR